MEALGAVAALMGLAVDSTILIQLFGAPLNYFVQVVEYFLKVLGLGGVQREAKTERVGILLAQCSTVRIVQLGRAIYWAARAYGRILSSQHDDLSFFVPAITATWDDLSLPEEQKQWLAESIYNYNIPVFSALCTWLEQNRPNPPSRRCCA